VTDAPSAAAFPADARDRTTCPACDSGALRPFHAQDSIPVNSCRLVENHSQAVEFPRGDLRLAFCTDCGFVFNTRFDPAKSVYASDYEETQGFSPRFVEFARDLAQRWIDRYDIHGKDVVEIGCGKGEFLALMCELGGNRGVGIDPSAHVDRLQTTADVTLIPEFYGPQHASLPADVIICRHTLEHISPVGDFMRNVRAVIGDRLDTVVLVELPDVLRVLQEVGFWDIYYEHCSYFSLGSLARLFRSTGFEVVRLELDYDDQYLLIEARPAATPRGTGQPLPEEDDMDALTAAVDSFTKNFAAMISEWRDELAASSAAGTRTVIWGGGSKGVAYLTTLGIEKEVEYAVDINPYKQGKFLAGTGQQVVGPDFLRDYQPGRVIAMNPVYTGEIARSLKQLGVAAELKAV
jgi:SAM-dependent methyltransferase